MPRAMAKLWCWGLQGMECSALTRFDNGVPPGFGLPRPLPAR